MRDHGKIENNAHETNMVSHDIDGKTKTSSEWASYHTSSNRKTDMNNYEGTVGAITCAPTDCTRKSLHHHIRKLWKLSDSLNEQMLANPDEVTENRRECL